MERFDEFESTLFRPPSDENTTIWRYMDFTRFMALLNSGSLHLTRCDQFDDHFEGSARQHDSRARLDEYRNEFANKNTYSAGELPAILGRLWRKYQRQYVYINCWHISACESAAMWRLYAQSDDTIAIQTTYTKLRQALPPSFHIGEVNYVDHQTYINEAKEGFFNSMYKRKSFAHERELRICYIDTYEFQQDSKDPNAFILNDSTRVFETVAVDLQALIESVRIAPEAPNWFVKLVRDSTIRFGYDFCVRQSSLSEYPFT
ncbi:DUF2971 domain-containing protein [Spirosoma horti]